MKILLYLPALLILLSCGQPQKTTIKEPSADSIRMIDYKMSTYKLFLGQDQDSIWKIFEFRNDYLRDDGIINDTGITHYMTVSEDVLDFKTADTFFLPPSFLPALFFTTDHKKMTEFECSIIASTRSHSQAHIMEFLNSAEPLFQQLRSAENKTRLATTYRLNIDTTNSIEYFSLDTTGRTYDILFNYVKKAK
jgi:hypothetical protein